MFKRFLQLVFLFSISASAQTYVYPALSTNNVFTGSNTFQAPVYFPNVTPNLCLTVDPTTFQLKTVTCGFPGWTVTGSGASQVVTAPGTVVAGSETLGSPLLLASGGTGATTAAGALTNLGGLPLTGGTLTGPLNGTSASFPGTVAAAAVVAGINGGISTQQQGSTLKQDARRCNDISATNGSAVVTSATCAQFTAADVGRYMRLAYTAGGVAFIGPILSVQSATQATLAANYTGTNISGNGQAIILSDDGAAMNSLISSQITALSSKGPLSLDNRPIGTTIPIVISGGRGTQVEGSGLASGIVTGLGAGAANGTTIIWMGQSSPITLAESGHTATATWTSGSNPWYGTSCTGSFSLCFFDVEGTTQSGYEGTHLILNPNTMTTTSIQFYVSATGLSADAGYTPTQDVMRVESCEGCSVSNLNILGSDQPSTKPRACIDMLDVSTNGPYPNSLNNVENVACGDLGGIFEFNLPHAIASTAQFGILADPAALQDDRNNVSNFNAGAVDACFAWEGNAQAQDWTINKENTCAFSGAAMISVGGGSGNQVAGTLETLQNGVNFVIGNGAHLDVARYNDETDGPARVNAPQVGGPGDVAGTSMLAEAISGGGGIPDGTLTIDHGFYDASSALNSNGDMMWQDGGGVTFNFGDDFVWTFSNASPPTVVPIIDLSVTGGSHKLAFNCGLCFGLAAANFNVASSGTALQTTTLTGKITNPNGNGLPLLWQNVLQGGDSAGVDMGRFDSPGGVRAIGGPVHSGQVTSPANVFNLTCTTSGSHTYYYKLTSLSGAGESVPISEYSVASCASAGSGNAINGSFYGVTGAHPGYKVYRSTATGGSGSEHYAFTIPANNNNVNITIPGGGNPNSFTDTLADTSLGTATPPTANGTGALESYILRPLLSTVTQSAACQIAGDIFFGLDGTNGVCGSGLTIGPLNAGTASNVSGTPSLPNGTTATTQSNGDSTTKLATDAFVASAVAGLVSSSGCGTTNSKCLYDVGIQSPTSMTGSWATLTGGSYTLPANTLAASGCVDFRFALSHSSGVSSSTINLTAGSTSISFTGGTGSGIQSFTAHYCNTGSTSAGGQYEQTDFTSGGPSGSVGTQIATVSQASTSSITFNLRVNATSGDAWTLDNEVVSLQQ